MTAHSCEPRKITKLQTALVISIPQCIVAERHYGACGVKMRELSAYEMSHVHGGDLDSSDFSDSGDGSGNLGGDGGGFTTYGDGGNDSTHLFYEDPLSGDVYVAADSTQAATADSTAVAEVVVTANKITYDDVLCQVPVTVQQIGNLGFAIMTAGIGNLATSALKLSKATAATMAVSGGTGAIGYLAAPFTPHSPCAPGSPGAHPQP